MRRMRHGAVQVSLLAPLFAVLLLGTADVAGARGLRETAIETGTILIEEVWARPAPSAGGTTAVYFRITNTGSITDYLIAAQTPITGAVELHTHIIDGDVMRMRMVPRVELPPGERVDFLPGGLHVMLIDLAQPLAEGDEFVLTLVFEASPDIELPVEVRPPPVTP